MGKSIEKLFQNNIKLSNNNIKVALKEALLKIDRNLLKFKKLFPSACSTDGIYDMVENNGDWFANFWTGQLWLAYELTGNKKYKECAMNHMDSFENRAINKIGMDDHDIGFSFTLSTVAGYKVTKDAYLRKISLMAAEQLLGRFREKGGFIQLIGDPDGPLENYRLIVDCLMNIHLLFWAAEETGREDFYNAAKTHFYTTINNAIRDNGSSYQNIYFSPETGEVVGKGTKQGVSDEACWSRGQAWVLCGLPLAYSRIKDKHILDVYEKATEYFFCNSPDDFIPYWDFVFTPQDNQPKDSSAAAIAVCGLLELRKNVPETDTRKKLWEKMADSIMSSLIDHYTSKDYPEAEGLLMHGCYYVPGGIGIDECMTWGDYFYLEAITRYLKPDWNKYW